MLSDFTGADRVYIACGYTDLRRGIDGLAELVRQQFQLDPFSNTLFLFCGRKRDRVKALYVNSDARAPLARSFSTTDAEYQRHLYEGKRHPL